MYKTALSGEKLGLEVAKYFWLGETVDACLMRQGILKAVVKEVTEENKDK